MYPVTKYSIITNFGCHHECPYCISNAIQVPPTDMAMTAKTAHDMFKFKGLDKLDFSGGGDPLWNLDGERLEWFKSINNDARYYHCRQRSVHTSLYEEATNLSDSGFTLVALHLKEPWEIDTIDRIEGIKIIRAVFVVTPDYTEDRLKDILARFRANKGVNQLTFRQMVRPDGTVDNTLREDLTYGGHGYANFWHYTVQDDYSSGYIVNGRVYSKFADIAK